MREPIPVYELARLLAQTPIKTYVKSMYQMETMGANGPEAVETGLIRLELSLPGRTYIRESSYTRHPDRRDSVSFSRATSFIRSSKEGSTPILDEDGSPIANAGLCTLIDALPHVQHYDLTAFDD